MSDFGTIKKPPAWLSPRRGVGGYENQREINATTSLNESETSKNTLSRIKCFRIRRPLLSIRPNVSPQKPTLGLAVSGVQNRRKIFLVYIFLLLLAAPALAQSTWYIRDDGGDWYECTGHTNAPLVGAKRTAKVERSGFFAPIFRLFHRNVKAADCALRNPTFLLKQGSTRAWRDDYHGGDTVWFKKNASGGNGEYPIGLHNPTTGRGIDMVAFGYQWCAGNQWDCYLPPIPSGTAEHPSRWLGPCYPNCSNPAGTDVQDAAKLVAVHGAFTVINVQGSEWFDIEGFEVTQYTQCTLIGGAGTCTADTDHGGHGIQIEYQQAQGPSNGILRHISVHGIAGQAVLGSHLNKTTTDKMVFDHIYLRGDGMSGFDSDGGDCRTSCENTGTVELTNSIIAFIGCVTPFDVTWDAQGLPSSVNYCTAQQTGGYGDGVSFIAMGAATVKVIGNKAMYNTQDAYDLLHMGDDQTHRQTLEFYNNVAIGNMGQAAKLGGGADTYAINNYMNGNCKVMAQGTLPLFAHFPAGWNDRIKTPGDYCRAYDLWAIFFADNRRTVFIHNTTAGYAAPMYDMQCAHQCTGQEIADFRDNISYGFPHPDGGELPSGFYFINLGNPFTNPQSVISHNLYYQLRGGACQMVNEETDYLCTDPQLADESNVDHFNPNMVNESSPAYGSGVTAGLPQDFKGAPWRAIPARGLVEMAGSGPTPPPSGATRTLRGARH